MCTMLQRENEVLTSSERENIRDTVAQAALDLIHADLCGKIEPQGLGGKQYVLQLLDVGNGR